MQNLSSLAWAKRFAGGPVLRPTGFSPARFEDFACPSHAWSGFQQSILRIEVRLAGFVPGRCLSDLQLEAGAANRRDEDRGSGPTGRGLIQSPLGCAAHFPAPISDPPAYHFDGVGQAGRSNSRPCGIWNRHR